LFSDPKFCLIKILEQLFIVKMNSNNEADYWQTRVQNFAEAGARMYGNEKRADILFVIGKDKEVGFL